MTISFDLDDTLIPGQIRFETAPRRLWHRLLGTEPLRAGVTGLMRQLRSEGHRIFIYTTSLRRPGYIRLLFLLSGMRLDGIINQQRHEAVLGERRRDHSKYPPAFGIDVHIDDAAGVGLEGRRHGFPTIIIGDGCADWCRFVLQGIAAQDRKPV